MHSLRCGVRGTYGGVGYRITMTVKVNGDSLRRTVLGFNTRAVCYVGKQFNRVAVICRLDGVLQGDIVNVADCRRSDFCVCVRYGEATFNDDLFGCGTIIGYSSGAVVCGKFFNYKFSTLFDNYVRACLDGNACCRSVFRTSIAFQELNGIFKM